MKILEAQSAMLSNFEASRFFEGQKQRYFADNKRRGPVNMEALVKEVQSYLRAFPNPLHEAPRGCPVTYTPYNTYSDDTIRDLVYRLVPYNLTKAEMIMVFNLRPENMAILLAIVEDADDRWSTARQKEMLDIITHALGRFPEELRAHHDANKGQEGAEYQEAEKDAAETGAKVG